MDFNTFLLRLGLDPNNFKNKAIEPIPFEGGFIYDAEEIIKDRICPYCNSTHVHIHNNYTITINSSSTNAIKDVLRIKKFQYKCLDCNRTFTLRIKDIPKGSITSSFTKRLIMNDFLSKMTFTQIAEKYHLSVNQIINYFDSISYVPRRPMPEVLCIDEIRFEEDILKENKFICILTNFKTKEVVDIIRSRRMEYLKEYFSKIPLRERENTKVFISDMYDAYASIRYYYFPKAIHIVDLFHIITQLTNAVNRIRTTVMNTITTKGSLEYNFMKMHWKYFLCRRNKIPDKFYTYKKTGEMVHYDNLVFECVNKDFNLYEAYQCLQELYRYNEYKSFNEASSFVLRISNRLKGTNNSYLQSAGRTYFKWRNEIANGFHSYTNENIRYTNAVAEGLNNQIKTIIKSAYGYHNFERFRKRVLLMLTYSRK